MTREQWLNQLLDALRPIFQGADAEVPEHVRVSCGWPSKAATARKNRRIGECWDKEQSSDEHYEIFVSPILSDSLAVADTLVHELVHACVGTKCGHRAPFRRLALAVGLEGEMRSSSAGEDLLLVLKELIKQLGPYPHGEISFPEKEKKQSTRLLKVECPDCGYTVRTTRKWLEVGLPTCCCGSAMLYQET